MNCVLLRTNKYTDEKSKASGAIIYETCVYETFLCWFVPVVIIMCVGARDGG